MPDQFTYYQVRRQGEGVVDYFVVPSIQEGARESYDANDANSAFGIADRINRRSNHPDDAWVVEITETRVDPPAGLEMT